MSISAKEYRRRGFMYRRLALSVKVLFSFWCIAMTGIFALDIRLLTLFISLAGIAALGVPSVLIISTFNELAERQFNMASATKEQALLGVVRPKNN